MMLDPQLPSNHHSHSHSHSHNLQIRKSNFRGKDTLKKKTEAVTSQGN
jgi:hypothetical protein